MLISEELFTESDRQGCRYLRLSALEGRSNSLNQGRFRGIQVYINERREADPVSAIREMSIDEVRQIQILRASEASARYGGDGYLGVIAITTRRR